MEYLAPIRKALVPLVVTIILGALAVVGVYEEMSVADAVMFLVTAFFVWLIPNKR